ncbi:UNVERIFIED_CONTAM: hypothetical protein GTU68_059248 [Idotea baltica]|nr:hypothetical protein [Idotea baltica]
MSIIKLSTFLLLISFSSSSYSKIVCPKNVVKYDRIILNAAKKYKVDPALIHAVIKQESCYRILAVSHVGAEGLMQLMPATADRFNVNNSFDAKQNIFAGTKYLAWLLKRFKGRVDFALAGYNAGEGRVDQYNGIPPFKETRKYVVKVMRYFYRLKGIDINNKLIQLSKNKKRVVIKELIPTGLERNKRQIAKNEVIPTGLNNKKPKRIIQKTKKNSVKVAIKKIENNVTRTERSAVANFNKKRTRIRSITIAMNSKEGRKGYQIIRARRTGSVQ